MRGRAVDATSPLTSACAVLLLEMFGSVCVIFFKRTSQGSTPSFFFARLVSASRR